MTDLQWETIDDEVAYACEGFDIVRETVRLPNGEKTEFDHLSDGESVVVLPFTADGDVVVIDEWRQAVKRRNRGLPAGNVEPDEDLDPAARRELREETGYRAGSVEHLTTMEPANGFSDAVFHYYVAHDCEATAEQNLDYNESIDVDTVAFESLVAAARDGELRDGRTAYAVVYYALFEGE